MAIKKIYHKRRNSVCFFCDSTSDPDYKNYEALKKFVSDRGKVIGSVYTGVCAKHQRRLSVAIKRARHLGLLPFTSTL